MRHARKKAVSSLVLWCLFGLLAACSGSSTGIGVIEYGGSGGLPINIDLPETAMRGEAIQLTLNTYGSCTTPARTEVQIKGLEAIVTPYDTVSRGTSTSPCPLGIRTLEHTATLTFNQVGTATVTVRGRNNFRGNVIRVTRAVTIQ
ncbi:MAG: hypothetical protein AAF708_17240 [Deinococcota bacterium]